MRALCNSRLVADFAALAPEGAAIECGVYDGATSLAIRGTRPHGRQYAADTFAGMPYDGSPRERAGGFVAGYLQPTDSRTAVIGRLRGAAIIPLIGRVEDTLAQVREPIAFAFFDLDLEAATRFAVDAILPLTVPGAIIGFHDYLPERPEYTLYGIVRIVGSLPPLWQKLSSPHKFQFLRKA